MEQLTNKAKSYEERLESQKSEFGADLEARMHKAQEDRDRFEKKYNEKWQAHKELERTSTNEIQNIEREKAVLAEKVETLESRVSEIESQKTDEIAKLKAKIDEFKSKQAGDSSQMQEVIDNHKAEIQWIEWAKQDQETKNDKTIALHETKVNYLEEKI